MKYKLTKPQGSGLPYCIAGGYCYYLQDVKSGWDQWRHDRWEYKLCRVPQRERHVVKFSSHLEAANFFGVIPYDPTKERTEADAIYWLQEWNKSSMTSCCVLVKGGVEYGYHLGTKTAVENMQQYCEVVIPSAPYKEAIALAEKYINAEHCEECAMLPT